MPKKAMFNERMSAWISGRWAVDRDDILTNDFEKKYSAYYAFGHYPMYLIY
jgi:hypothetical protein